MAERLRSKFPIPEVLPAAGFLGGLPEGLGTPLAPYHRFRSESPNALFQLGPRLLTVNVLPPYPGFEVFRELIHEVLKHYQELANSGSPVRVGLRYINHLKATEGLKPLGKYLNCAVEYPRELAHPPSELALRLLMSYGELGTLAFAVSYPARVAHGELGVLLDLDFFWEQTGEFPMERFSNWLEDAHNIVYLAFTSAVPEEALVRFRGGQ